MNRVFCIALCAAFAAAPFVKADDPKACEGCPVSKEVQTLLASWKDAAEAQKATDEATRKDLDAKCASLCKECPLGSRVGGTVAAFQETLAALIASDEACAGQCPLAAKAKEGDAAALACKAGLELKAARAQLIKDLHALAGHLATATNCSAGNATAEIATEPGATKPDLTARLASLEASWKKAGGEFGALAPEKQKALGESMAELSKSSKSFALVGPSLVALTKGFDTLATVNGKMGEWVKANAAAIGEVPPEAHKAFAQQHQLVTDAAKVGALVRESFKGCGACTEDKGAAK